MAIELQTRVSRLAQSLKVSCVSSTISDSGSSLPGNAIYLNFLALLVAKARRPTKLWFYDPNICWCTHAHCNLGGRCKKVTCVAPSASGLIPPAPSMDCYVHLRNDLLQGLHTRSIAVLVRFASDLTVRIFLNAPFGGNSGLDAKITKK